MRPIIRSSSLSRIRWALRNNQERYSSSFYSKSRKIFIGVNQNQALVNTNTDYSGLYSRLSILRGLSAEAVEAAVPATRLTVSGFCFSFHSSSINLRVLVYDLLILVNGGRCE